MSDRTNMLPQHLLRTTVDQLEADLTALKNAQRTSGRSGVLGYQTKSALTWDATGTIGSDSSSTSITSTFSVNFTGDGTQSPVIANLSFLFYVNGTDTAHQLTAVTNYWTDTSGRTASLTYGSVTETQTSFTQTMTLITQKAVTYYIKVYAVGSSGGTVSAVKTS